MQLARLIEEFSAQLAKGKGAIFAGSGVSAASGLPDWFDLISKLAVSELGITVSGSDNLPLIAQYIVNSASGNRGPLIRQLRDLIGKPLVPNSYHLALATMNLETIWTTNYDTLLEEALPSYFVRSTDALISHPGLGHLGEIIKIHGCIRQSASEEIVITSEDYEDFFVRRPATAHRLKVDLVRNSFLFIGYGYGDPNISNIMIEARRLAQKALGNHYLIQRRTEGEQEIKKQNLWAKELERIGVACAFVDEFSEIETALFQLAQKSRGHTLFVTGRHTVGSDIAESFGPLMAEFSSLTVLDGQSTGIGRAFISKYSEACLAKKSDIRKRLRIYPNPYAIRPDFENNLTLLPQLKNWRKPLFNAAQIVVVFDGGHGTSAEVEVAKEANCIIVPVPETENDLPSKLLEDPKIAERLSKSLPTYLDAARSRKVTSELLRDCVKSLLMI